MVHLALRTALFLVLVFGVIGAWRPAAADTMPTLFDSFAGNINFTGMQKTLRTQPDSGDSCAINTGTTTATLAGLPAGATIRAAYLYWAASGNTPDYNVTFEGVATTAAANRRYTATFPWVDRSGNAVDLNFFSGVANVTNVVAAKLNGDYTFTGLTVDTNWNTFCYSSTVLGGWALLVIYQHNSEDFRVINVYEGFQHFRGSSITLTPSNFQIPVSPINGKNAHLTWEGDVGNSAALGGFTEQLTFNGNVLSDASNPVNNQFNSVSSINSDAASYGVDFDVFDVSSYLTAGDTSATTVYSSGGDLVLLSAQVISTTNEPVADLEITMTRNSDLTPGQNASYTLNVINNGPLSEPGPLSVVNTLPAGLTYVSASGTGWSCSAAGQVVTCSRVGALASGVSAPSLTLTVAVSGGASGQVTNSATVSGQAFDNISWNNTATDSFYILLAAYAYYAMDEAAWTGAASEVIDSSGNNRHATTLGGITTLLTPAAGNKGDTCRGTDIPANDLSGTIEAVDTGRDINDLGNAGTISFWYRARLAWNSGGGNINDRILFDATPNSGNGEFWLVLQDSGQLRFRLDNASNSRQTVDTAVFNGIGANTWAHVAVTWNFSANTMCVYVNGASAGCRNDSTVTSTPNYSTLYIGDNRGTFTNNVLRGNSANGAIDEVRLYSSALTAADIAGVMALTHSCAAPLHHVRIEHGSGASLTCNSSTLTLRACADAGCTAFYTGGVTGSLTAAGAPTVNWVGGTGFTIASGASTVTKDMQVTTPGSVVFGTSGVNPVPGTSTSCNFGTPGCTFTAVDSGFIFDVPNHTADTTQNVTLAAVRTDDVTQKCVPAFQSVSRTVNFWSSYLNPNSGTLALNLNGGNIAGAGPGTGTSLSFDANGETTLQVRYPDVGQMRLNASYAGSGTGAGLVMTGQDNFVTKPARFVLTIPGNPAAADASGGVFKLAGESFTVTVEARNASDAITPNYGRESVAETVLLTKALAAPAGGNNPALSGSLGAFGLDCSGNPGTAGTACGTFSWPEVGIITLTPSVGDGDYLGSGDVSGTGSGNIGRFTPAYFNVTKIDGCSGGASFTYSRQPFTVIVTAKNTLDLTTENYDGTLGFAKDVIVSNAGDASNFTNNVIAAGGFASGIRNQTNVTYSFPAKETPLVTLALRALDGDSVSSAGHTEETAEIRSGRLRIINAYGSELGSLSVPLRVEYFSADGWVRNTDDTCTALAVGILDLQNAVDNPGPGDNTITIKLPDKDSTVTVVSPSGGTGELSFTKPGEGGEGYADAGLSLSAQSWLRYDWDDDGTEDDPAGRASFGLYRGSPKHIYQRQRY